MASLERLRGLILTEITCASKSSPTTTLGALLGLELLYHTVAAETGKAAWRNGGNNNYNKINIYQKIMYIVGLKNNL